MKYYFWLSSFTHFFVTYYVFLSLETFGSLIVAFSWTLLSIFAHVFLALMCNFNYYYFYLTEEGEELILDDGCQYSWFYFISIPTYFYTIVNLPEQQQSVVLNFFVIMLLIALLWTIELAISLFSGNEPPRWMVRINDKL